ncbi:hypothetical protein OA7_0010640 [Vibrio cyclitrophicus 1F53]|uniref:hypothetical protein n=1 Tax=Vibrio cyclitrophicus TaxID=47951 RepID=UPI0002E461F0|nr:hypothetical protein [Vibrio cyclitrophicus]OEF34732.1 hypothetical protein OA7_10300 [Vibrio cyclitrophicus 1F53]OEF67241.1 hypothetical protein OAA_06050 [Vibrio cyclitrophicus 1F175]PMH24588.1 hypothetical protein BCU72_06705 [Vibrio cyclitrophicus]
MYITKAIGINDGWNILNEQEHIFSELEELASLFTFDSLLKVDYSGSGIDENATSVRTLAFTRLFRKVTRQKGWRKYKKKNSPYGYHSIPYFRRNVAIDAALRPFYQSNSQVDRWALIDAVRDQDVEECFVSVLFVLDKLPDWLHIPSVIANQYDLLNRACNSDLVLNHIESQVLPLYHDKPLVILSLSEESLPCELIELNNLGKAPSFERVIEFSKENYQAGVGILSYFGEVLKQKYPDINAKVRIEQDDCSVRMTIDTPDGGQDIIEEAFETYTQVVVKEREPEALLDSKLQVSELKMQLTMIEAQLEHKKELLMLADDRYKNDVIATRNEVEHLRDCLKKQMQLTHNSQIIIGKQISKEEKVSLAQIRNHSETIQTLVEKSSGNQDLMNSLSYIQSLLERDVTFHDEGASKAALKVIHNESPGTFSQLSKLLENSMYGVSGNIIFGWMTDISQLVG